MPYGNDMVRINQFNLFGLPVKSEGFSIINNGEMNRQYSYYELYPSLNLFTPFHISEGFDQRISDKESGDKKDLTKENDIYFTYALFAVLAGTVCYILFKPLKN